jgi:hypothetical protein
MPDTEIWATRADDTQTIAAAKKSGVTTHPVTMKWGRPESQESANIVSGKLKMPRRKNK